MSENVVSEEVVRFLHAHVDSVLELEAMLMLRDRRSVQFTPRELARDLKVDTAWAAELLARFHSCGIVSRSEDATPAFAFAPKGDDLERAITAVADAYGSHRVTVIATIFAKPVSRLKSFADAFRFRKEKE